MTNRDRNNSSHHAAKLLDVCKCSFVNITSPTVLPYSHFTHWGRVTHICVGNLTIIGPENGFSPGWRQAIIWTNAGILLIGPLGTKFSEILIGIQTFSFEKMHQKMSSAKWRPFCLGLNESIQQCMDDFGTIDITRYALVNLRHICW